MSEPFDLKPISIASIPRALEKAERYRLLNEPEQAESICPPRHGPRSSARCSRLPQGSPPVTSRRSGLDDSPPRGATFCWSATYPNLAQTLPDR
jgi:hypothetical protein